MDTLALLLTAGLTVWQMAGQTQAQAPGEGPCFDFPGDAYLHFTPNNFDNDNDIHISLQFRTTESSGVLLYSRGNFGDDEALYVRDGKLRYRLFNTSPSGVEGYFGGDFGGDEIVNTGNWVKVHLYRSWPTRGRQGRARQRQTGIVVEMAGQRYSHLDYLPREDITLAPTIYLGGYREQLSSEVHNFIGQIKDIREEKNGVILENPSLNYMSRVILSCLDIVPA